MNTSANARSATIQAGKADSYSLQRGGGIKKNYSIRRNSQVKIKIDVTKLREDERLDMAKLLIKSDYAVRIAKEKDGNKYKHIIIAEKG